MSCGCKDKAPAVRSDREEEEDAMPAETFTILVRNGENPLACPRCLEKHICKALVYAAEAQEERRPIERALASVNLSCAREHAEALGDPVLSPLSALVSCDRAPTPADIRALLPGGGDKRELAIGRLGAAEDALRVLGNPDAADLVRQIRLSITPSTKEN